MEFFQFSATNFQAIEEIGQKKKLYQKNSNQIPPGPSDFNAQSFT